MGNSILLPEDENIYVFSKEEMKILYQNFIELDQDQSAFIEPEEFFEVDEIKENPIVKRVISVFDKNQDGKISFFEFVMGLSALTDYSYNKLEKLKFAFQVYDTNGDGFISSGDLFASLKLFTGQNLNDIQIQQVVDRTMISVDKDLDGKISFDEFVDFVQDLRVYELFSMNIFN